MHASSLPNMPLVLINNSKAKDIMSKVRYHILYVQHLRAPRQTDTLLCECAVFTWPSSAIPGLMTVKEQNIQSYKAACDNLIESALKDRQDGNHDTMAGTALKGEQDKDKDGDEDEVTLAMGMDMDEDTLAKG